MAGDWIKMRTDLYRDPKVCIIADMLGDPESELSRYVNQNCRCDMAVTRNVTRNAVVGALVSVWGVLRHRGKRQNADLVVAGSTLFVIDDLADIPGFGDAMASVGWVVSDDTGIVLPNFFEEFNVDPSEERARKNAERQRRYRENKSVTNGVTEDVTRNVTRNAKRYAREEKRRERVEKSNTPPNPLGDVIVPDDIAERIYSAYPRKVAKPAALKAIRKALESIDGESLLVLTEAYNEARRGQDMQYTPHPATWFNGQRWADDPQTWRTDDKRQPDLFGGIRDWLEEDNVHQG